MMFGSTRQSWKTSSRTGAGHVDMTHHTPFARLTGGRMKSFSTMPTFSTAKDAPTPGLMELFFLFNRITLVSFGGGLTAWARKLIVEEKKWLDDEEFLSAYALARVLPGANQANFAIYVGNRF